MPKGIRSGVEEEEYTEALALMRRFAKLVNTWYHPDKGLLDGFLRESRSTQQSIIQTFLKLMKDWHDSKPEIDEENGMAFGFAKLIADIVH